MVGLPQGGSVSWNLLLLAPLNYSCGMFGVKVFSIIIYRRRGRRCDPNDRTHTFFSKYLHWNRMTVWFITKQSSTYIGSLKASVLEYRSASRWGSGNIPTSNRNTWWPWPLVSSCINVAGLTGKPSIVQKESQSRRECQISGRKCRSKPSFSYATPTSRHAGCKIASISFIQCRVGPKHHLKTLAIVFYHIFRDIVLDWRIWYYPLQFPKSIGPVCAEDRQVSTDSATG
jgi:hypothetical protein